MIRTLTALEERFLDAKGSRLAFVSGRRAGKDEVMRVLMRMAQRPKYPLFTIKEDYEPIPTAEPGGAVGLCAGY